MVAAARAAIGDASTIADLFAGLGTFALSLGQGRRVYAAEGERAALRADHGWIMDSYLLARNEEETR